MRVSALRGCEVAHRLSLSSLHHTQRLSPLLCLCSRLQGCNIVLFGDFQNFCGNRTAATSMVASVGGRVVDDCVDNPKDTVLLVTSPVGPSLLAAAQQTLAVASGAPIVSWRWFVECKRSGVRLPTAAFEIRLIDGVSGAAAVDYVPPVATASQTPSQPVMGTTNSVGNAGIVVLSTPLSAVSSKPLPLPKRLVHNDDDDDDDGMVPRVSKGKQRACWKCGR
jgi:hypothetical protein